MNYGRCQSSEGASQGETRIHLRDDVIHQIPPVEGPRRAGTDDGRLGVRGADAGAGPALRLQVLEVLDAELDGFFPPPEGVEALQLHPPEHTHTHTNKRKRKRCDSKAKESACVVDSSTNDHQQVVESGERRFLARA